MEKAVNALLSYWDEETGFGGVDETAMCIMALGNHKDITGVEAAITKGMAYLKANQRLPAALKPGERKTLLRISSDPKFSRIR